MEYSDDEVYKADPTLYKMVELFKLAHETEEERKERLAKEAAEAKAEQEKKQNAQPQPEPQPQKSVQQKETKTDEQQSAQAHTQGETKMKFCQNCGEQLQPGAKFCPNCGMPTGQVENAYQNTNQSTNDASVRKQEFVGTIRKCPSCGAEVPAFAVTCPACGMN